MSPHRLEIKNIQHSDNLIMINFSKKYAKERYVLNIDRKLIKEKVKNDLSDVKK